MRIKKFFFIILIMSISNGIALQPEFDERNSTNEQAFIKACAAGNLNDVEAALKERPTLTSARDARGRTGLMFLAQSGNKKVVQLLLKYCNHGEERISHEYKPGEWYTARTYAEAEWNEEIARLLPVEN